MSNNTQFLVIQDATTMSNISFYVALASFLASLPVVYVLRGHWKSNVCYFCCRTRRNAVDLQVDLPATQPDIILSIILCLQTCDLFAASAYLLNFVNDSTFVCAAQGALAQTGTQTAIMFSMCLSIELWIVLKSILEGSSSAKNGVVRLFRYCLLSCFISLGFVLGNAMSYGFGRKATANPREIAWCWLNDEGTLSFVSIWGVGICACVVVFIFYGLVVHTLLRQITSITHPGIRATLVWSFVKVGVYPILMTLTLVPGLIHRWQTLSRQRESNVEMMSDTSTSKYWLAGTLVSGGKMIVLCCSTNIFSKSQCTHVLTFFCFCLNTACVGFGRCDCFSEWKSPCQKQTVELRAMPR